ncbi:putative aldehyde dehydrogenase [Gordonia polyisoprenivorans VH2]|uniref:2,5-dioxovalerate dehydrogenase n=2 Tax=Gordonia polyisoprenivorans TaxID=84595 RepID=H6MZE9_GORPV|nr:aldehyde dehydrogenase (NADP(+)) [Gordonia polyisoprenivorans]AFA75691.1 putative aldehyde dehydrogenase [Gordonia polyisoprenivorans VH2]NKY02857.1 aldehyde dehydrogenase (NADP(+)) [Gordonia polyisoprenivorans]WCB37201.1 aldehyde dehydrogenase (NADP(+)) [Gordonia polyisoprenivorans]GAB24942.1 putative aldehyde dehydrogenase [Gordonia polyisoprenivorans NBRC 16320 = JCM 10675]
MAPQSTIAPESTPTESTPTESTLTGQMIIAGELVTGGGATISAIDPATGEHLEPSYRYGSATDVTSASIAADAAFDTYRSTGATERAAFLERIAERLDALTDDLVARAGSETGLPAARLTGEVARTSGQLRLFADTLREGSWQGARIDPALPGRTPLPRADIRQRKVALGPVAVFGASNFPLAFSVAGGDTASALAAGCPVIVKAHDAHPGTSELVGRAITDAARDTGMPAGVFSLLYGDGPDLGIALVTDPRVQAVGFTGSRGAGLALVAAAQGRPRPIPVYVEMSSINPVFPLPAALATRAADLGAAFVGSLTLGAGQFCTNPGVVIAVDGPDLDTFISAAASAVAATSPATMLSPGIAAGYRAGVDDLRRVATVEARGLDTDSPHACRAALFSTDADTFLSSESLRQEVFGASSIVVKCRDTAQVAEVAAGLDGQLTATVHADDADLEAARALLPTLERTAGRILFNGWPTGVEVGHAMVHGGPFPATSDARSTSVGSRAIERFLRPVAYQDVPAALLPGAIADGNPQNIWRRIDGALTRD